MSMPTKGRRDHHLSHHHHQQQQSHHVPPQHQHPIILGQPVVHSHSPQTYSAVVTTNTPRFLTNAGSEFHVPGQNYGAQPGGQVGGGAGNVGVPAGRGPPSLGGIQTIGQSTAGIPPGGPAGGQAPSQVPTPGVQSQPPQGPAPTTTPPVHTPSSQEMGKQAHLQTQPPSLPQVYVQTQNRPTSQGYYQTGPRPQQPRGISHRGGQGTSGTPVVGMAGVGGGGQPPAIYPHPAGLPVQAAGAMYVQGQVHGLHTGPHQQSVYPMNNQIPIHQFSGPPQRHQPHQNQTAFYQTTFQSSLIAAQPNVFGYTHGPPQHGYYYTASNTMGLTRTNASAVSGGAQHVPGPLAGTQGAPVVPQGTLQPPTQQAQSLPPMGIPLSQADVYSGHNGGVTTTNNTIRSRKPRGQNAILDIVNPLTGKNISDEIYKDNETTQSGESSNRGTPQPQNNGAEVIADFAARVAKAATEESNSVSETTTNTPQATTQMLSSTQTNLTKDTNSQCNTEPPTPTRNIADAGNIVSTINSQSLDTSSNTAQVTDSVATKTESKTLQFPVKEFQPRSEVKNVTIEESLSVPPVVPVANKESVPVQLTATTTTTETTKTVTAESEPEAAGAATGVATSAGTGSATTEAPTKSVNASSNMIQTPITPYWSNITQEHMKPSATATSANSVPVREPFPNLSAKTTAASSNSPPRRKSNATELPSNTKEQKERKTREKSLGSRGTTPTPVYSSQDHHHHQKANGDATGEKSETEVLPRNEIQQKPSDGKAMQKQKSKNKLKPRDLNRKGAEKEGTDMDAFNVNPTAPTAKTAEIKPDNKEQLSFAVKDANKETGRDTNKETKEKESLPALPKTEKHAPADVTKESSPVQAVFVDNKLSTKEAVKEPSPKIEDTAKSPVVNTQTRTVIPNDVVDHAKVNEEILAMFTQHNEKIFQLRRGSNDEKASSVTATITEKNTESETCTSSNNASTDTVAATTTTTTAATLKPPSLKYTYKEDQWSPINMGGKKIYDRDFLMKLQYDPNSKIKPVNLPNLQVILKDNVKNTNEVMDLRFKDANITRHDALMPGFAKTSMNARLAPTSRKSDRGGKPNKPTKGPVISLSLSEDVKLRETENAWKPARLKHNNLTEDQEETLFVNKAVRSILNKLTPQKFTTLVGQVRRLKINTPERLQGVINLVFEKAVDEPSFSVEYALLCKELAMMEVVESDSQDSPVSFKKLIITRCQKEFEKNPIDDVARTRKLKEIEECTDNEKKKELQLAFEEEERRIRVKSVGNIRFIGELYKQQMLTTKIMHRCIRHLLDQNDEDNLECLCKLLTTIGKDLEFKGSVEEMQEYFNRMQEIVSRKNHSKISSRIRFMLQDVIDLRANKWIPRRNENNPKTIDQIQKEAESERLDMQLNSAPLNTPRKDDRNSDRKRNRGGLCGPTDDGWSQPVGRVRPTTYSVETAKLKNKPPPMDDMQLGNRASYLWRATTPSNNSKTISSNKFACLENMSNFENQDRRMPSLPLSGSRSTGPRECGRDYKSSYDSRSSRNGHQLSSASSSRESSLLNSSQSRNVSMPPLLMKSASQSGAINHKPPMSEQEFTKTFNSVLKDFFSEPIVENTGLDVQQKFDNTTFGKFMRECINHVLEKSPNDRNHMSKLLSHLLKQNIVPVQSFKNGLGEVLEDVDDLVIDIPKIWTYLAEIVSHSIADEAIALSEMESIFISLRSQGSVGKFIGELLTQAVCIKGEEWISKKWNQSGLQLSNLIDPEREDIEKITREYSLEFLTGDCKRAKRPATTMEVNQPNQPGPSGLSSQIPKQRIQDHLQRLMKENTSFDEICNWIATNVGDKYKEPTFIRELMTAILETTMEQHHDTWKLNVEAFGNLQTLLQRFIDASEVLELQCLYAIQLYMNKIEFPSGILNLIMNKLWLDNVISTDAFLTWQRHPEEHEGHAVAMVALTSFFTDLQEPDDNSSVEELSTSANQGC